jgi:ribosome-binding factor A
MWRAESVGRQIQEELSDLIHRHVKDPRLGYVTVTDVQVTRDLKFARVYVSVMGDGQIRDTSLKTLQRAMPFLRKELGRRIRLRHVPELEFKQDQTLERASRIDRLLDDLKP